MRWLGVTAFRKPFSSLSNRLLLTNLLLIVSPLLIVGVFSYNTYAGHLERATELYATQILGKLKEQVDDLFGQLDNSLTALWIQNDLQKLVKLPQDKWKDNPSEVYSLSKYISNLFGWREGNRGIFILTDEGLLHQEMTPSPSGQIDPAAIPAFVAENRAKRHTWISEPHRQNSRDPEYVVSINRPVLSIPDYDWSGIIRYDLDATVLYRLFESTELGTSGYFIAIGEQGDIFYRPSSAGTVDAASIAYPAWFNERSEGSFQATVDGVKYVVSFVTLESADWKLVGIVPWSEIVEGADAVRNTLFLVGCLTILAGLLIIWRLNGILLKPLHHLNRAIRKLGGGDFDGQIPIPPIAELQAVAVQYNHTAQQLKQLTEELYTSKLKQQQLELAEQAARMKSQEAELRRQETELRMREAEFSQLQAQINPHFLYNTLSSIDSMAEAEKIAPVRQAVGELSRMFRYTVSSGQAAATLEEEIQHVRSYATLQQFRYEERIRVRLEIADEALPALVPRLTLQPFVENAYYHGLEEKLGGGLIRVSAEVADGRLALRISDDGAGMAEDRLAALRQFIDGRGSAEAEQRLSGIRNVIRRLFLTYGTECGIEIDSAPDAGTQVRIEIPYVTGGDGSS